MRDILLTINVKLYTHRKHQPSTVPEERLQAVSVETWTVHVIRATRPVRQRRVWAEGKVGSVPDPQS